jgi:hypothetical protein
MLLLHGTICSKSFFRFREDRVHDENYATYQLVVKLHEKARTHNVGADNAIEHMLVHVFTVLIVASYQVLPSVPADSLHAPVWPYITRPVFN